MAKERMDYIDKAKGILIILVVLGHIKTAGYGFNWIYTFHMPAFFAISGILMNFTASYEKPAGKYITGRMYAIGLPFIFMEILGVCLSIIRNGVTLNWKGYLYNTLTFQFNDPELWFLVDLFVIEVLFMVLKKISKMDWPVVTVCIILFIISVLMPKSNGYLTALASSFRYFPYFVFGFYCRKILDNKRMSASVISLLVVSFIAAVWGTRADSDLTINNLVFMVAGFFGTYMILQFAKLNFGRSINMLLSQVGRNSIIIYTTHHIIYATVGVLLGTTDYDSTPFWAGLIMFATVMVLEIPLIYVINRWMPFWAGKHYQKKGVVR